MQSEPDLTLKSRSITEDRTPDTANHYSRQKAKQQLYSLSHEILKKRCKADNCKVQKRND
jgi:hypothetical protein